MTAAAPLWVQWLAAALIVIGSLFALAAALGLVYFKDGFQRLHPPALASTCGAWCVSGAALAYFSALEHAPALYVWLIPILLAITVPVSTLLIARAALFRRRQAGDPNVPPPLQEGEQTAHEQVPAGPMEMTDRLQKGTPARGRVNAPV